MNTITSLQEALEVRAKQRCNAYYNELFAAVRAATPNEYVDVRVSINGVETLARGIAHTLLLDIQKAVIDRNLPGYLKVEVEQMLAASETKHPPLGA